jgi:phage virion morphogenesis protein
VSGATLSLTFEDHGAAGALASLARLGRDPRPMLDEIGAYGESSTRERFDSNVDPTGAPWKPSLRVQLRGGRTLVGEGHLRDEIHYDVPADDAVEWGSSLEYAAAHQWGAHIEAKGPGGLSFMLASGEHVLVKSVDLPARAFLGLSAEDDAQILSIVQHHELAALAGGRL